MIDFQEPLQKFYGTASYKTKTRNLRVAEYAFKHKGIDRIMQETGCTDRWQSGQVRSLFVVGEGDFGSKRGPSLHMTFLRRLKRMVMLFSFLLFHLQKRSSYYLVLPTNSVWPCYFLPCCMSKSRLGIYLLCVRTSLALLTVHGACNLEQKSCQL